MIDPQYMREEILNLAEVADEEGMNIILNVLEEEPRSNMDDAFDVVERHVTSASPEDLKWIHEEISMEGLFDWYGG